MCRSKDVKTELLDRVAELCHRLPMKIVESICETLEQWPSDVEIESIQGRLRGISEPSVRVEIGDVLAKWLTTEPESNFREFAQLLRGAAASDRAARARQDLELVWTGPSPPNSSFRRTDQALLEVINSARKELWVVSYASYRVPEISAALVVASERGVQLRLVLESKEDSDGALSHSALRGLGGGLERSASVYIWPSDRRSPEGTDRRGLIHAKCAVADGSILFVSSANLTGDAMTVNMEMGVLIRGSTMPSRVAEHLTWLVEEGILEPLPRP